MCVSRLQRLFVTEATKFTGPDFDEWEKFIAVCAVATPAIGRKRAKSGNMLRWNKKGILFVGRVRLVCHPRTCLSLLHISEPTRPY